MQHCGYLVEDVDGLLLVAFPSSRAALQWAVTLQEVAVDLVGARGCSTLLKLRISNF